VGCIIQDILKEAVEHQWDGGFLHGKITMGETLCSHSFAKVPSASVNIVLSLDRSICPCYTHLSPQLQCVANKDHNVRRSKIVMAK